MPSKKSKEELYQEGRHRGYPKIVAEGDSWFSVVIYRDLIDHLSSYRYAIRNAAHFGDEIERDMLAADRRDEWLDLIDDDTEALVFSGGGNDILDVNALKALIVPKTQTTTQSELVDQNELGRRMVRLKGHYEDVIALTHQKAGRQLPIVTHGYDYIVPRDQPTTLLWVGIAGPWAWKVMNSSEPYSKGITLKADRTYIMKTLVDAFNDMLTGLATDPVHQSYFKVVDARNTIQDDWKDEIHPNSKGFRRVARKFHDTLKSVI
jgi:hypothetical protein